MAKISLPLTVSVKNADLELRAEPIRLNPFANMGITSESAPVLLSLEAAKTVGAEEFAVKMVKTGGQGTLAQARLFQNATLEVLDGLVDEYGAVTVQMPMGTVQTFIAGTVENPQDQPDPEKNYAFLALIVPEQYRKLFAQIETYIPTDACPAALKRVRDKATNAKGIRGTDPFYLEGRGMTIGGEGETLELVDPVTRDKLCDVSVDGESKSTVQLLCTLAPQTALEAGTYLMRMMTLAGGEPGAALWPIELKVEILEAPEPPAPVMIDREVGDPDGAATEGLIYQTLSAAFYGTNLGHVESVAWKSDVRDEYTDIDPAAVTVNPDGTVLTLSGDATAEMGDSSTESVTVKFTCTGGQTIEKTCAFQAV